MTKFIFVTGGVFSAVGKGVIASSIGNLLSNLSYSVSIIKCDPYINIDPGTLNPKQHGEVFVTFDGGEVDLDFGHYERFLDTPISKLGSITTGSVYNSVITKERSGYYKGSTVQIFHITQEIKDRIYNYALQTNSDFVIVEIGGTVGDLESIPFLEASRQIQLETEINETCFVHCTYVPFLSSVEEFKTKPSQHSIKLLNGVGITPDILIARSETLLPKVTLDKLAQYCYIRKSNVISAPNLPSIYFVPSLLESNNLLSILSTKFNTVFIAKENSNKSLAWTNSINKINEFKNDSLKVIIVGKYTSLKDSYISIKESLEHSALYLNKNLTIYYLDVLKPNYQQEFSLLLLHKIDAVVIAGGFGLEGTQNIKSILTLCKLQKLPTLAICLGFQLMCIEHLNSFSKLSSLKEEFNSTEFDKETYNPLFDLLPNKTHGVKGGSLKLGTYPTKIKQDSIIYEAYDTPIIYERHRHRYELNNSYRTTLTNKGFIISGTSPDNSLVNCIELRKELHPFYVGVQFHPEFQSTIINPHPLFIKLLSI